MRFKAKLAPEQVSLLHSIIIPMTRLHGGSGSSSGGETTTTTSGASRRGSSTSHHHNTSSSQHNLYTSSSFARNGTILYFDTDHVRISCKGNNNSSTSIDAGITCFVELNAQGYTSIFLDRRIESVAPNNAIVMEIDIAQLRLALKSVLGNTAAKDSSNSSTTWNDAQRYVVIKLAKRQNIPCLCIDACSISSSSSAKGNPNTSYGNPGSSCCTIQVHHAIPVRILRHTEMTHHLPPPIQQSPTVQLELVPSLYNLRTVIDRLKHISSTIYLEANNKGELTISANTDGASIQTYFSKFVPRFDTNANDSSSPVQRNASVMNKTARIKMDTRKLAASLQWQQQQHPSSSSSTNPNHQLVSSALLCLIENEMVVVHVNLYPLNVGFFTYYVPVHYLSNDPYDD